jgi:polygalacturonase
MRFGYGWGVLLAMASVGVAQDTRTVTEPVIPPSCVQLPAMLQGVGDKIDPVDEQKLDTDRIQAAMDKCKPGMAVELKVESGKNAFLTGPLELRSGVTLLIDEGVTLYGSRDPKVYEMRGPDGQALDPVTCGTSRPRPVAFGTQAPATGTAAAAPATPPRRGGCRPLISATNVTDAAIMGYGTIDGRGYAKLLGKDFSWWEMARKAEPKDDVYFSTRLLVASHADGLVLYRITLHNSPNFHVSVNNTNGFTAWGVHLLTPVDKKLDARNTDGIDPGNSTDITIAHSWIDNGDDNVAIKANVQHMSVLDNHFYTGHGMSIGSEATGDAYILVDGLTEDHTTSGIRIKSNVTRGGPDHDLTYKNICMRGVQNPIAISPYYTNQTTEGFVDPGYKGTRIPDYKKILLENVYSETPGDVLIAGIDDAHRTEIELRNVLIKGITASQVHLAHDDITSVSPGSNLDGFPPPVDKGVVFTIKGEGDPNRKPSGRFCDNAFVPMQ